jgi:signal transduction histidine kinase
VITFAVETAIMAIAPAFFSMPRESLLWTLSDAAVLTAVMAVTIWMFVVRPLRYLLDSREQLIYSLFQAQEQERSRIACDLHDEIGQQLTAIQVGLGTIEAAPDLSRAQHLAHDLRTVGATAHEEVRRLVRGLRPGVLEELGLAVAVERLCEDFQVKHGIELQLDIAAKAAEGLALPVETTLYRILQESLTNVARHAQATHVEVALTRATGLLALTVADNGLGMDAGDTQESSKQRGIGLDSIGERVQMLRGECTIGRSKQGGVLVEAVIPI